MYFCNSGSKMWLTIMFWPAAVVNKVMSSINNNHIHLLNWAFSCLTETKTNAIHTQVKVTWIGKNIVFSYTFPTRITNHWGFQGLNWGNWGNNF